MPTNEVIELSEFKHHERWEPNPGPQEDFASLPDEIKEGFYGGAFGGGKTWILIMIPVFRRFIDHPKFHGIIFRKTYKDLEQYLVGVSKEYYPKLGAVYNETKHFWRFPSGSILRFSYMEDNDDAYSHDGTQYNYIGWDELTHFDEFVYRYLFRSSRSGTKDLPAIIRSTSNPGNIGHTWVRKRFVEPDRNGYKKIWDGQTKSFKIFIPSKIKDNPKLIEANPNYINELNNLPEAVRKAKMEGDWWAFSGQVFDEFRDRKIDGEPEHALHVIKPYAKIPDYWPKIVSIDWGFTHKTAAHWHAISPHGKAITYREYTAKKSPIGIWGADIGRLSRMDSNIILATMDPSAWKTESTGRTIAEQFMEASQMSVQQAINDRLAGKQNYHEMLRWEPRPARFIPPEGYNEELAQRIWRIYGEKAHHEYCNMFQPDKPEINIPKWQIYNTCTDLIDLIPRLVYDETKTEDVAKFDGDDSYDDTRYGLMAYKEYISQCAKEFEQVQKVDKIQNELEKTGDQNAFYRKMEFLENKTRKTMVPYNQFKARRAKRSVYRAS